MVAGCPSALACRLQDESRVLQQVGVAVLREAVGMVLERAVLRHVPGEKVLL